MQSCSTIYEETVTPVSAAWSTVGTVALIGNELTLMGFPTIANRGQMTFSVTPGKRFRVNMTIELGHINSPDITVELRDDFGALVSTTLASSVGFISLYSINEEIISAGSGNYTINIYTGTGGMMGEFIRIQNYYVEEYDITTTHVCKDRGYRYGFNGQEKDDEVKGSGNAIVFEYRVHDPRLGRFLSIDPLSKAYPGISPYIFAENRVIDGMDFEGREWSRATTVTRTGNKIVVSHAYTVKLQINNYTNMSPEEFKVYVKKLEEEAEAQFKQTVVDGAKLNDGTELTVKISLNIEFDNNTGGSAPFQLDIRDQVSDNDVYIAGHTQKIGGTETNILQLSSQTTIKAPTGDINNDISKQARTLNHELLHSAGLRHTGDNGQKNDTADPRVDRNEYLLSDNQNIMIQGGGVKNKFSTS